MYFKTNFSEYFRTYIISAKLGCGLVTVYLVNLRPHLLQRAADRRQRCHSLFQVDNITQDEDNSDNNLKKF